MSHLPPRPEFNEYAPPSRFDRPGYHGRPAPMAPEHAYPPSRERDVYLSRSPPPPPRPLKARPNDSYITTAPYMPRDSYLPPPPPLYDRRDDDRARDAYHRSEWERRDRDRGRDYPPPPPPPYYRDRYRPEERSWTIRGPPPRERPRSPFDRVRDRDIRETDPRAWTRRDHFDDDRRRRRDPPGVDRVFIPRRSASPPRNFSQFYLLP